MSETYIDKIVNNNGNRYLHFCYGNYGYNTLFVLPNFACSDDELERNQSLIGMCDDIFELDFIIEAFIRENSRSPFITRKKLFSDCVDSLNEKLNEIIIDDDYTKFNEASVTFDRFLEACKIIMDDSSDQLMYAAYHDGWESILPERKYFNPEFVLLKEMYEDTFYPDHLVDIIRELFRGVITILERGEKNNEVIQKEFDKLTGIIYQLEKSFNKHHSEFETVARDSIFVTTKHILEWFHIPIDTETAIRGIL